MNSPMSVEPICAMSGRVPAAAAETSFWWTTSQPTEVTSTVMPGCSRSKPSASSPSLWPSSPMPHTVSVCFSSSAVWRTGPPEHAPSTGITAARATATPATRAFLTVRGKGNSSSSPGDPVSSDTCGAAPAGPPHTLRFSRRRQRNVWDFPQPASARGGVRGLGAAQGVRGPQRTVSVQRAAASELVPA